MKTKIFAVTNQKGGVGKTTTAINVAAALVDKGFKVLLIDMDPQSNATVSAGFAKKDIERSILQVMSGEEGVQECLLHSEKNGFDVLPANDDLVAAESVLSHDPLKHALLKKYLSSWVDRYDFVFIDCPPTLNLLTVNALVFAEYILVPIQCEYFALEGVSALLDTVGQIKKTVNPNIKLAGFVRTMYDPRSRLTNEVSENLKKNLKNLVFDTAIPRNVRIAEAPSFGLSVIEYDKRSKGAEAYQQVTEELLSKMGIYE